MASTAPLSHMSVDGPLKRKWELFELYERHLTSSSSSPSVHKKPRSLLERYLSTKPANCVRVVFQSDNESDSEESVSVRPWLSEDEDDVIDLERPPAAAAAGRASHQDKPKKSEVEMVIATGQENDPIVLSDSDESDGEDETNKAGAAVAARPSPTAKLVTPSGNHKQQESGSSHKGRFVSSESSCDSSAISSVIETPDTKPPRRAKARSPRKSGAARRLYAQYDSEDSGEESPEYDSESESESEDSDTESVDSEQVADEFYCSPPPEDPHSMFSLQDFKHLWRLCEKNLGEKTEDIEGGRLIRQANTRMVSGDSKAQCKAQYGRILPNATDKLLREILKVEQGDVFVDVGHGIGNAVLQAAYTVGCESRGIEVVGDRNFIALRFQHELDELRRIRREVFDDPRGEHVGEVQLKHGRLELPDSRDFITNPGRRTKAFVNNFDGVFAERSAKLGQKYHLDHFIAGLFGIMEPGSIMVTLHPLTLGHSLESANDLRSRHGLEESDLASFFKTETVTLGEAKDVVSWSQGGGNRKPIQVWVYTRLAQPTDGAAVFLCNNPKCEKAQDKVPQDVVGVVDADGEGDRLVIAECDCGFAARPLRTRRRVDYNSPLDFCGNQWPY